MKKKILILGAGIAGLAAGRELQRDGHEVVILEARDRIGGRTYSDHSLGFPFDVGASLIHGDKDNPLIDLAKSLGVEFEPLNRQGKFLISKNEWIDSFPFQQVLGELDKIFAEAAKFAKRNPVDVSLAFALNQLPTAPEIIIDGRDYYPWAVSRFTSYNAAPLKNISARHWDLEQPFEGENYVLKQGYSAVSDKLAEGLTIYLNTWVSHIEQDEKEVRVKTTTGSFNADYIIVTAPLGVLKSKQIIFTPSLPEKKQAAINHLQMGVINKFTLKFDKVFWPLDARIFAKVTAPLVSFPLILNIYEQCDLPILVGFFSGDDSIAIEALKDKEVLEKIMRNLREMFGAEIPNPVDYKLTRWKKDKYTLGSYSYPAVGSTPKDFEMLAEPVGRVMFAGEATVAERLGTVHGAYLSGLREAERVRGWII